MSQGRQMERFKEIIAKVADGHSLSVEESAEAFDIMMSGAATPAQMGAFLMALRSTSRLAILRCEVCISRTP